MYWSKYLLKIDLSLFLLQLIVYHIILQKSVEHYKNRGLSDTSKYMKTGFEYSQLSKVTT